MPEEGGPIPLHRDTTIMKRRKRKGHGLTWTSGSPSCALMKEDTALGSSSVSNSSDHEKEEKKKNSEQTEKRQTRAWVRVNPPRLCDGSCMI